MMDQVDFLSIKIGEKKKKLEEVVKTVITIISRVLWWSIIDSPSLERPPHIYLQFIVSQASGKKSETCTKRGSKARREAWKLVCVPHSYIHPLRLLCTKFIPTVKHTQKGTFSVGYQCVSILIDLWEYECLVPSYFFDSLHMLSIPKFMNW